MHIKQLQLLHKGALISVPTKEKCNNKTSTCKWKMSSQKLHLHAAAEQKSAQNCIVERTVR
jgi:hypothetical protein